MARKSGTGIGVYGNGRTAIAPHDDGILPVRLDARDDLAQRDHPPRDGTPDLHTRDDSDILAFLERRTRDDRKQPGLLREETGACASRLTVKAGHTTFQAGFHGLRNVDARDAIAGLLEIEYLGANDLLALTPVGTYTDRPAVRFEDSPRLDGEFAQLPGVRAAEAHLYPSAAARSQKKFLRDRVGVGILLVQAALNLFDQSVDLLFIIDIDQELNECGVRTLRCIHEQEAQAAATDKRSHVSDAGLASGEAFDAAGERFRFPDVRAGREKRIDHELRPGRGREEALVEHAKAIQCRNEEDEREGQGHPPK